MDIDDIRSVVKRRIESAGGAHQDQLEEDRSLALRYYQGDIGRDAPSGRSNVTSRDLADAVDGILPDLMEIFGASDNYGSYDPQNQEDEAGAAQAADWLNYVVNRQNDGYVILHDWIKTALMQRNGYVKCWVEPKGREVVGSYKSLSPDALPYMAQDPEVERIDWKPNEDGTVSAEVTRCARNRIVIEGVPPEELLIEPHARSLAKARFVAHMPPVTRSDLVAMGFDREAVSDLPAAGEKVLTSASRNARDPRETAISWQATDEALENVDIYECYLECDVDGDGVAEFIKIFVGGTGYEVLPDPETGDDWVKVEYHPFIGMTPYLMPYRQVGMSLWDKLRDIQEIKTVIQRQTLDNMYNLNNSRYFINDRVSIDDFLKNRVGGAIPVSGRDPVSGCAEPLVNVPIVQTTVPMLQYWDSVAEVRTFPRLNQGVDPSALNDTAFGLNLLAGKAQKGILYIARTMAETGLKDLAKRVLQLTVKGGQEQRIIRLRNKWVPIDPRSWNADMDFTTEVGLGTGTSQQKAMALKQVLDLQTQAIQMQGGANGPAIKLPNVVHTAQRMINALGFRNADDFIPMPTEEDLAKANQPPPPDPMIEIGKADVEAKRQKAQMDAQIEMRKLQIEEQKAVADAHLRNREVQIKEFQAEFAAKTQIAQVQDNLAGGKPQNGAQQQPAGPNVQDTSGLEEPEVLAPLGDSAAVMSDLAGALGAQSQRLRESAARMREAVDRAARPRHVVLSANDMPVGTVQ